MAGASVVRRSAFLELGGYEPRLFLGGEETLLTVDAASAGWEMAYVPSMVAHHYPSPRRDTSVRRRLLIRNALWCAWLRLPIQEAWARTRRLARRARREGLLVPAFAAAAAGVPWILRHRRVAPAAIRQTWHLVESE
jgi:GT2 family glycosyltransferase